MKLIDDLALIYRDCHAPFLLHGKTQLSFPNLARAGKDLDLAQIRQGDVVALVGDFDPLSIVSFLTLIDRAAIVVPLTVDTRPEHAYFFEAAHVDAVLENGRIRRLRRHQHTHPLLEQLRVRNRPGLVLFFSGTTGRPKAILHDFSLFLERFRTPRPTLCTINFLLFDHIGGINTLFHTLFNRGTVVVPSQRTVQAVLADIEAFHVELLPTTPTFLRMMLISGVLEENKERLKSQRLVTYGTERMDQPTLDALCTLWPSVDFRQTFGISELGILRVKSQKRDSLWMKIGGEGVETKVVDAILTIRSSSRMLGYLNADSPFDEEGWYDTKDMVEQYGEWIKVTGRASDVISVGGIKFLPSEIERVALAHPDVIHAKAIGVENPITGQHVELTCELRQGATLDRMQLRAYLKNHLPKPMHPHRIRLDKVAMGHRFKKL